jgi:signal transduction histidine kinase
VVVEFRLLRQEIWRALRAAIPASAPTGDIVAAEIVVNDALDAAVTQGLAALNDQVEQVREEFLATTVHDVRQPLTAISGDAQLIGRALQREQPNIEQALSSVEHIQASVRRMLALLDMLTDMSKVALGSLELRIRITNLEDVVRAVLARIPPDEVARLALNIKAADGSALTGQWDAPRLEQVVSNLLGNAFKYSPPGTPIDITLAGSAGTSPVKSEGEGEGGNDLERELDSVTLEVRDYGIGIPSEDLVRVFSRYTRATNATELGTEGQGLGLFLSRGIVTAHGGRIWAESGGIGRGTTVTVVLPRRFHTEE